MARQFEYTVRSPLLPPGATSPVMDFRGMEGWLNEMDAQGWELVTYGQTLWRDNMNTQEWWIFRRPATEETNDG